MSRIMGEAAPLVVVGAAALVLFDPSHWLASPERQLHRDSNPDLLLDVRTRACVALHGRCGQHHLIVLLAAMNSVAIILREHFRRRLNP